MSLQEDVQSLDQAADIFVYEITGFNQENPAEKFRFSNFSGISWGGPTTAIPCQHDVIELATTGTQPRLQFTVADVNGFMSGTVDVYNGLEGAKLKIRRTKRKYLDDGATPDTSAILQEADFIVARVADFTPRIQIVFECVSLLDFGDRKIPQRLALRTCPWVYRSPECTYTGPAMFTIDDQPTVDPNQDRCGKFLSSCKARNNVINYGGFPTLSRR